jgi:hypothetical protein
MSVDFMVIQNGEVMEELFVPISSQRTFRDHWIPAGIALNLEIVYFFEFGTSYNEDDIPMLCDVFQKLRSYFEDMNSKKQDIFLEDTVRQIDLILEALEKAKNLSNIRISIG